MKTQISNLLSGSQKQFLNPEMDYSKVLPFSKYVRHYGSNSEDVKKIWDIITNENPNELKIKIKGIPSEFLLKANWSISRKSVSYWGYFPELEIEKFHLKRSKKGIPSISIQCGNMIIISNGKKDFIHVCPSLIEIL